MDAQPAAGGKGLFGQHAASQPAAGSGVSSAFGMPSFGQSTGAAAGKSFGMPSAFAFGTPASSAVAPTVFGSSSFGSAAAGSGASGTAASTDAASKLALGFGLGGSSSASASSAAAPASSSAAAKSFSFGPAADDDKVAKAPLQIGSPSLGNLTRAASGPLRQTFGLGAACNGALGAAAGKSGDATGQAEQPKPLAKAPAQPPLPSRGQVAKAQQAAAAMLGAPSTKPSAPAAATPKAKHAQPPLPSRTQVAQAQQAASDVLGKAPPPKPAAAAKPAQPPLPSRTQAAQAQQAAAGMFGAPQQLKRAAPPQEPQQPLQQQKPPAGGVRSRMFQPAASQQLQPPVAAEQRQPASPPRESSTEPEEPAVPLPEPHLQGALDSADASSGHIRPSTLQHYKPACCRSLELRLLVLHLHISTRDPRHTCAYLLTNLNCSNREVLWYCIAGEGKEVEGLEADFLQSLFETRKLEAELSAALRPLLDPQVLWKY